MGKDLGDFVVWKTDGGPAYQLAVVVDDQAMGVTEDLPGDDLLPSASSAAAPASGLCVDAAGDAVHVPLVVGPGWAAARETARGHADCPPARERGVPAERLIGFASHGPAALHADPQPIAPESPSGLRHSNSCPAEAFVMTDADWKWLLAAGCGNGRSRLGDEDG